MKVLAIDTAAHPCAACIYDLAADTVLSAVSRDIGRGHVEHLMPVVQQVLDEAGLVYDDLDRIGVSIGPGSFTGVRVGVATARGFSLALAIPAIGISTADAIAADTRAKYPGRPVVVALDARRGEIYAARYDASGLIVDQPHVSTVKKLGGEIADHDTVLVGTAAPSLVEAVDGMKGFDLGPKAATAPIGTFARLAAIADDASNAPKPLYLRAPDAKPQQGFAIARVDA